MLRIDKKTVTLFIALVLLFPWLVKLVPPIAHYVDVMVFAGVFCLITLGLSLFMGFAGQISLGHAAFYGLGAYTSAIMTVHWQLSPWLGMGAGMVLAAAVAFVVGLPALKLKGHYLAMATLSFGIIVHIVFNEETRWTGGPDGMGGIPGLSLAGFAFDTMERYYYLVWGVVVAALLFSVNLLESGVGRALRAVHASEPAAAAMGVNVAGLKVGTFVFSAVLASLAGSFYVHYLNFINPSSFDLFTGIKLLIMIALGGMHSLWGAIVGGVLITFLNYEWLHYFHELEVLAYGAILMIIVIFMPRGLVSLPAIAARMLGRRP